MEKAETRRVTDPDGRVLSEQQYQDGKPHGIGRVWNLSGRLVAKYEMANGQYHGEYRTWWDNGNPKEVGRYEKGEKAGLYRWYRENGTLWSESKCSAGQLDGSTQARRSAAQAARELLTKQIALDEFLAVISESDGDPDIEELEDLILHQPQIGGIFGVSEDRHAEYMQRIDVLLRALEETAP